MEVNQFKALSFVMFADDRLRYAMDGSTLKLTCSKKKKVRHLTLHSDSGMPDKLIGNFFLSNLQPNMLGQ